MEIFVVKKPDFDRPSSKLRVKNYAETEIKNPIIGHLDISKTIFYKNDSSYYASSLWR
jgi:hypothetical protein